jgi:Ca2+-binding EF-hand superfamily protein
MIFMWIKRLGRVTRDEFLNKITDIIGDQSPEATEIINNVFELVDFEDTGYISKGEFFDF